MPHSLARSSRLRRRGTCAFAVSGRIAGLVTDSAAAVVPETSITVTNVATSADRKVTTSENGNYTVPQLLPGEYRVTVEHPGFKPVTRLGVILDVDQRAELDFTLEVGGVAERIEVTPA